MQRFELRVCKWWIKILFIRALSIHVRALTEKILVSNQLDEYSCELCLKFESVLKALDYGFESPNNISFYFIDNQTVIDSKMTEEYKFLSNRTSLKFTNKITDKINRKVSLPKHDFINWLLSKINHLSVCNLTFKRGI